LLDSYPGFEFFRLNIICEVLARRCLLSDEDVFYELLQENEYSDTSVSEYGSDSKIIVNISSGGNKVSGLMKQKM
jgi:hypothetical protein